MTLLPEWLLTPERTAIHRPTQTAVIADLHLGYALARQRRGEAVPERRLADILAPLQALLRRHRIHRLVIAGDLYEDGGSEVLVEELLRWLEGADVQLVGVVPGNHDRGLKPGQGRLPIFTQGMFLDDWHVIHGDGPLPNGRVVQGHLHPCLRWQGRIAAPCYLASDGHLILPAFSTDAAGANIRRDPRWQRYRCHVITEEEVLDFGELDALPPRQKAKSRRQ